MGSPAPGRGDSRWHCSPRNASQPPLGAALLHIPTPTPTPNPSQLRAQAKQPPPPPPPRTPHQPSGFHKPRSRRAWDIIPNRCRWRGKITFSVSAGIKPGGEKPPPRSGGAMGFATRFLGCRRPNVPVACKQGKQEEASGPRKIKVAQAKCNHQPPQTRGFREGTQVAVKP